MCTGNNARLAKYAARLLGLIKQTAACETIIQVRASGRLVALGNFANIAICIDMDRMC